MLTNFQILKQPWIHGTNLNWLWCVILSIISRSSLLIFYLRFLQLCSWEKLASTFPFCNVLVRDWYQVSLALWNGLGSISSFCFPKVFAFHCFVSEHHSFFFFPHRAYLLLHFSIVFNMVLKCSFQLLYDSIFVSIYFIS